MGRDATGKLLPNLHDDQLYTVEEFASRVGISVHTLRKHVRRGLIYPAGRSKARGTPAMYTAKQVVEYRQKFSDAVRTRAGKRVYFKTEGATPIVPSTVEEGYSGSEAQRVYREFRKGHDDVEVVIQTGMHPAIVGELRRSWVKQGGGLLLSKHMLDRVAFLPLDGPVPSPGEPWTEKALYEVIRLASLKPACEVCGKGTRRVCKPCVEKALKQASEPAVTTAAESLASQNK